MLASAPGGEPRQSAPGPPLAREKARQLCLRWTVGDVSPAGFEALFLSVMGARRLFGRRAIYAVCVNTITVAEARRRSGLTPGWVRWLPILGRPPAFLAQHLGAGMTGGAGWKLVPPRLIAGADELALDNDVILWDLPAALRSWLDGGRRDPVIAEDVAEGHGKFAELCGPAPRNSGIRAVPASFGFEAAMQAVLAEHPVTLESDLDEQGLQIAAVSRGAAPLLVTTREVSICSPFPPHFDGLGACGAHFVGLNARSFPWSFCGRPAIEARLEHWQRHRSELYARIGLPEACRGRREAG